MAKLSALKLLGRVNASGIRQIKWIQSYIEFLKAGSSIDDAHGVLFNQNTDMRSVDWKNAQNAVIYEKVLCCKMR